MTDTTTYPWTINGVSVQTLALNLDGIDGWTSWPGKRGRNPSIPYRHGAYSFPDKSFAEGSFLLNVVAMGTDVAGDVVHAQGGLGHIYDNIDTFMGLLYSTSLLDVRHPTRAGVARQAMSEVLDSFPVTGKNMQRSMAVLFRNPGAFWRELPAKQDITTGLTTTGSVVLTTGGNAPIGDAKITMECTADGAAADPSLTGPNGEVLGFRGSAVIGDTFIFDIGERTLTKEGAKFDSGLSINRGKWLELPPKTTNYTLSWAAATGTWTVTVDWYNKWF